MKSASDLESGIIVSLFTELEFSNSAVWTVDKDGEFIGRMETDKQGAAETLVQAIQKWKNGEFD